MIIPVRSLYLNLSVTTFPPPPPPSPPTQTYPTTLHFINYSIGKDPVIYVSHYLFPPACAFFFALHFYIFVLREIIRVH